MSKPITKEDLRKIQFYQMPKVFFRDDSPYQAMKNEAKLAYMLLQDLLPLSIENNWVNEKREVFVKLSRSKLMALLNIKGTQKIAQVMKELVDYGLIIYKRVGLTKCNEIYICLPETKESKLHPQPPKPTDTMKDKIKTLANGQNKSPDITKSNMSPCESQTHIKNHSIKTKTTKTHINPSIHPKEMTEEIEEIAKHFSDQLDKDYLTQQYDQEMVEEIINNICDMHRNKTTIIQGQAMPRNITRNILGKLKMHHIEHVINQFLEASSQYEIRHTKKYLQTLIYNSVFEAGSKIRGQVRYEMGY